MTEAEREELIDIERTLRLLDVEAESNFVQAEAIDAINYLLRENARYKLTQAKYVEVIDRMNGTPCEQIRHQQEVEALREENARLNGKTDGGEADDCKSFGCLFESWKTHYQKLTTQNAALREENERLREEVERLKKSVGRIMNARDQTENSLREENARLKEEIEERARSHAILVQQICETSDD